MNNSHRDHHALRLPHTRFRRVVAQERFLGRDRASNWSCARGCRLRALSKPPQAACRCEAPDSAPKRDTATPARYRAHGIESGRAPCRLSSPAVSEWPTPCCFTGAASAYQSNDFAWLNIEPCVAKHVRLAGCESRAEPHHRGCPQSTCERQCERQ